MRKQSIPAWANRLISALQALWTPGRPLALVLAGDASTGRPDGVPLYRRERPAHSGHRRAAPAYATTHALTSALPEPMNNDAPMGTDAYGDSASARDGSRDHARCGSSRLHGGHVRNHAALAMLSPGTAGPDSSRRGCHLVERSVPTGPPFPVSRTGSRPSWLGDFRQVGSPLCRFWQGKEMPCVA